MSGFIDARLTKLRILADRAKRDLDVAERRYLEKRKAFDEAWLPYYQYGLSLGQCVGCEKSASDCTCGPGIA